MAKKELKKSTSGYYSSIQKVALVEANEEVNIKIHQKYDDC